MKGNVLGDIRAEHDEKMLEASFGRPLITKHFWNLMIDVLL